jgi:hypothetical protein
VGTLAVRARVAQEVQRWWQAEEEWCALPVADKRRRGQRRAAGELLLPGMPTGQRAYPRRPDGSPDHAEARDIEAARIGAAGMLAHALQLAQAGELVDPAQLTRDGARQPERPVRAAGKPRRRRAARPRTAPRAGVQPALPGLDGSGRAPRRGRG